jgi:2'-5' RNA ligase
VIRAFFAVFLGPQIAAAYAAVHAECTRRFRDLRWVAPGNLHLTVRFLGEADERRVAELEPQVGAALAGVSPFRLVLGEPGGFGERGRLRTLWLGLAEGAEAMADVAHKVAGATHAAGWPRERRPFGPHVTLARNPRGIAPGGWEDVVRQSDLPGSAVTVENVALVSSRLQPHGPEYTTLWSSPLGRAASSIPHDAP